jgi:hypothetical protein
MPIRRALLRRTLQQCKAILTACLTCCVPTVNAQAPMASDQLFIPNGTQLCRSVRTEPADSVGYLFQFIDARDSSHERISMVAFDSAGAPLHMMLSIPGTYRQHERRLYMFAVQFFPNSQGGRLIVPEKAARLPTIANGDTVGRVEPIEETLTAGEVARAKALAEWFWAHRCQENVGDL